AKGHIWTSKVFQNATFLAKITPEGLHGSCLKKEGKAGEKYSVPDLDKPIVNGASPFYCLITMGNFKPIIELGDYIQSEHLKNPLLAGTMAVIYPLTTIFGYHIETVDPFLNKFAEKMTRESLTAIHDEGDDKGIAPLHVLASHHLGT